MLRKDSNGHKLRCNEQTFTIYITHIAYYIQLIENTIKILSDRTWPFNKPFNNPENPTGLQTIQPNVTDILENHPLHLSTRPSNIMQNLLSTRARERDKIRVWLLKVRLSSILHCRWPRPTPVPSRFAYSGFAATSNWRASSSSFDWFVSRETGAHSTLRRGIIKRTECKDQGESGRDEKAESRRDRERRGEESSSASLTPRVLVSSCAKKPTEITGNSDDAALRQHRANQRTG